MLLGIVLLAVTNNTEIVLCSAVTVMLPEQETHNVPVRSCTDYSSIKVLCHPERLIRRDTSIIAATWAYLLDSLGVLGGRFSGRDFPKKLPARIPLLHRPTVFHPPGKEAPVRRHK